MYTPEVINSLFLFGLIGVRFLEDAAVIIINYIEVENDLARGLLLHL
jgi:hypothetical protein